MTLAHTGGTLGGAEPELLIFGAVAIFLAFLLRPSQTGNGRTALIALVVGVALILGSFTIHRL